MQPHCPQLGQSSVLRVLDARSASWARKEEARKRGEQELGPGSFPGLTHHAAITRQTASVRVILLVRVTVAVVSVLAFA